MVGGADASTSTSAICAGLVVAALLLPAEVDARRRVKLATVEAAEPAPNLIYLQTGAQVGIHDYTTFVKLVGGYARWLMGSLWLDGSAGVLILKYTNLVFNAGVRWRLGDPSDKVRGFLRAALEAAVLFKEGVTRMVIGARGGGGIGYYSSPTFGVTAEANLAFGPSFGGGGATLGGALDLLLGVEFLF